MKILRSPLVVALLAGLAFLAAGWNIYRATSTRGRSAAPAAVVQAPTPGAATTPSPSPTAPRMEDVFAAGTNALSEPIDSSAVRGRIGAWVEAPVRDPFEARTAQGGVGTGRGDGSEQQPKGPKAEEVLSLNAIWRQVGGRLVVINSLVMSEGERIGAYQLQRIEEDAVLVVSTNGTERVALRRPGAPPIAVPAAGPS